MFFWQSWRRRRRVWPRVLAWTAGVIVACGALAWLVVAVNLGQLRQLGFFALTGFPGGRDYLVVLQNDAERRPTGGFITAYAVVRLRAGVPLISFGDVYDPRLIRAGSRPPDPTVADFLAGSSYPGHGFRDANLTPDWPATARDLAEFYRLGFPGETFDGIFAVDFTALQRIVAAVGGAGDFNGELLFAQLEESVQNIDFHNPEEVASRKNVLGELAFGVIKKVLRHPGRLAAVFESLQKSLADRHALLFFADSQLQKKTEQLGWAGRWPAATVGQDFLAVVEGNYGGLKSSRYLLRDVNYDVTLADPAAGTASRENLAATARLAITVSHRGTFSEPVSGYYQGYLRVYAPRGAALTAGNVNRSWADDTHQIFELLVGLQPGETRVYQLAYRLPQLTLAGGYQLHLAPQPGGDADLYRVTVGLPAGYLAEKAAGFLPREGLAVWRGLLDRDQKLSFAIRSDTQPPRLAWQKFVGGIETIELRFAEPLDPASLARATFSLTDADYRNHQTDTPSITAVRLHDPQTVWLTVAGLTPACREWFRLTYAGVADRHGNAASERTATVVQWLTPGGQNCDPENRL